MFRVRSQGNRKPLNQSDLLGYLTDPTHYGRLKGFGRFSRPFNTRDVLDTRLNIVPTFILAACATKYYSYRFMRKICGIYRVVKKNRLVKIEKLLSPV